MAVDVGQKAPDFMLPADSWDDEVSLESARREGTVVLFFYPGDWSSVCMDQMGQLQQEIVRFEENFQREVVEDYGVMHDRGFPERAYFVIDKDGVVRAKKIEASPSDQPEIEAVLEDLEKAL